MALFQKKPAVTGQPLYTLGARRSVLIVGLGNPGREYANTRHNVGFAALDNFVIKNDFPAWMEKRDLRCQLAVHNLGGNQVILCKPMTFMNASGEAVGTVQRFYRLNNQSTLVVYDELAIPFGQIRTRVGGTDAGHNGVKSLISHIGEDFGRLRIGIANQLTAKAKADSFVLGKFAPEEQANLPVILQESAALITEFIFGGDLPHETRKII